MNYKKMLKLDDFNFLKQLLYSLFVAGCIALITAFAVVHFSNSAISVVLSDSMFPEIQANDILIVQKQQDYKIGDVVQFNYDQAGISVMHRIVCIKQVGDDKFYICHGDNEISVKHFYLYKKYAKLNWKEDMEFLKSLTLKEI